MIAINKVKTVNLILRVLPYFAIICVCNSCRSDLSKWEAVSTIADDNKDELETVLDFYKNNYKKYEAAKFLIYNMGHSYTTSSVAKIYRDKVLL
ncbi:MAG: hypothetical protein PHF92_07635 [Bacteroidales bacterium]|nr:hypothetical protein [Bacteroidales bacterium]